MWTCSTCRRRIDPDVLFCGTCGRRSRRRADVRIGAVLGDTYRIEEKLGEGGFGAVYRVTHVPSELPLALKLLHADLAGEPACVTRFRREADALAALRDPHTVSTFERGELRDGTLFIAMELLHGETLRDRLLLRGRLPWPDALRVLRAACSSLGEAHAREIIHRDINPANLHLGADDFVKVLDFGIAKLPETPEQDEEVSFVGVTVGTLDYMAPEQLLGMPCSPRSDIYALGIVGYEMICGRRPFVDASSPMSHALALLGESPPRPSTLAEVPEPVEQLLLRCLERDPAHRFATVVDLARAIDRALAPAPAPPPPRIARMHRVVQLAPEPEPRGRRAELVLGAMICGVGAAIAWVALS